MKKAIVGGVVGVIVASLAFGAYYIYDTKENIGEEISFESNINVSIKKGEEDEKKASVKGLKFGYNVNSQQMYMGIDKVKAEDELIVGKNTFIMDETDYYLEIGEKLKDLIEKKGPKLKGNLFKGNLANEIIKDLGELGENELVKTYIIGSYVFSGMEYYKKEDFYNKLRLEILKKGSYEKIFSIANEDKDKKYLELKPETCDYIKVILASNPGKYIISDDIVKECKSNLPDINKIISKVLYVTNNGDYDKLNVDGYGFIEYGKGEIKEANFSKFGQIVTYKEKKLNIDTMFVKGDIDFSKDIVVGDLKLDFNQDSDNYINGFFKFEGINKISWDIDMNIKEKDAFIKGSGDKKAGDLKFSGQEGDVSLGYKTGDEKEISMNVNLDYSKGDFKITSKNNNLKVIMDIPDEGSMNIDIDSKRGFPFMEKAKGEIISEKNLNEITFDYKDNKLNSSYKVAKVEIGNIKGTLDNAGADLVITIDGKEVGKAKFNNNYPNFDLTLISDENGDGKHNENDIEMKINGDIKFSLFNMIELPKDTKEIKILDELKKLY